MIRPATWTIHQVTGAGCAAGFAALLFWPVYAIWPDIGRLPFIAALAIAAGCGVAMLVMTLRDLKHRSGRGSRLRPIRAFDIILGLLLSVPTGVVLRDVVPEALLRFGF